VGLAVLNRNNMYFKFAIILLSFSFSFFSYTQNGFIRGTVLEEASNESMPGVKVAVQEIRRGAYTDLDGKFSIPLEEGTYSLKVMFFEYDTVTISDIKVVSDEVTLLDDIFLIETANSLQGVTVVAERKRNTESALLSMKLKADNMIDGISSSAFRKIGDSDAASAMKRVPGVSLAGGKYVYVRGLGDRYNKTMLNSLDIPGLDPDRNTLQMDIFPTNVIENMIVHKSFSAELPADFSGGLIDIELKNFPDKKVQQVSVQTAFNPNYHLRDDYLNYEGGKTDFLGFDDGTREIPAENNIPIFSEVIGNPNGEKADRYKEILGSFNRTLAAKQATSGMDFGMSAGIGNQFKNEKNTIGYSVMMSYKNQTKFYKDAEYGLYGLSGDPAVNEMDARVIQMGDLGENNVLLNVMGGVAVKTGTAKHGINVLHIQNGQSSAGIFDYTSRDQGADFDAFQHNLEYSERSLTNVYASGAYSFIEKNAKLDWRLGSTFSSMDDPDVRFTRYEVRANGNYHIGTEVGFPQRIWRSLNETNYSGRVDYTKDFEVFERDSELKFGLISTFKSRDFDIKNFALNIRNPDEFDLTGNPDELFFDENLWPLDGQLNAGTTYEAPFIPTNPNEFNSNVLYSGGYASLNLSPLNKLKIIIGLRSEYYVQRYTGQDQLGTNVLNNDVVLEDIDLFPTLNMTYAITEKQNLRLSATKTIARPSFKEVSYAEIFDPITGRTFVGGLFRDANDVAGIEYWDGNLVSSDIYNFDLRWEIMHGRGQTVSVSGFYKFFNNPIEIIQFATLAGAFQPRNVGDGQILGTELEIRQGFGFIKESLSALSFVVNVTYTESRIQLSKTEFDSRVDNKRIGQEVGQYRDMAGQAPIVINAGFAYTGGEEEKGFLKNLEAGIYYNVQGRTLLYAGMVDRPDIYTVPFHSLNMNIMKKIGKESNTTIGLKVTNLLNDYREEVFQSFNAQDMYFTRLGIGTTFQLKLSHQF
jgi:TonB-dependent receptor